MYIYIYIMHCFNEHSFLYLKFEIVMILFSKILEFRGKIADSESP